MSWTVAAVVAFLAVAVVQTTVRADGPTTMTGLLDDKPMLDEIVPEEEVISEVTRKRRTLEDSTMAEDFIEYEGMFDMPVRNKRSIVDATMSSVSESQEEASSAKTNRRKRAMEDSTMSGIDEFTVMDEAEEQVIAALAKKFMKAEEEEEEASSMASAKMLEAIAPTETLIMKTMQEIPPLSRRLMAKRMAELTMAGKLAQGAEYSSMARMADADSRGLLDGLLGGLLGGGGSGGNCTSQGGDCNSGQCCPTLACIDVSILGLNLCL